MARPREAGGGAGEDRTPDLLIANEALSQLSYGPATSLKEAFGSPKAGEFRARGRGSRLRSHNVCGFASAAIYEAGAGGVKGSAGRPVGACGAGGGYGGCSTGLMVDVLDRDDCRQFRVWGRFSRFAEPITKWSEPAEPALAIDKADIEIAEPNHVVPGFEFGNADGFSDQGRADDGICGDAGALLRG